MQRTKNVIIREIQRLHARREPLNISAVKRNHPKLIERVYKVQPFWGWKRALEDAGLDYSEINTELLDYVDCKICGKDLGGLSYHLVSLHQVTPKEYREDYPDAEIVSEMTRSGISRRKQRHRPPLPNWEEIWTPEYVLDRMAQLHRRKCPMNFSWAKGHESALTDKAIRYFGSWDNALRHIGLDPAKIRLFRPTWRGISPWRGATKTVIIAELRRRKRAAEALSWKKLLPEKFGPALLNRGAKLFGSWSGALRAARLDPFHGGRSPWADAEKSAILVEIQRRKRTGLPLGYDAVCAEKWGQPLIKRAEKLFGSWRKALLSAGIEPERGRSQWADATKVQIVAEIRRRKRAGRALLSTPSRGELHGRALRDRVTKLFGTWNAALRAAGIEPFKENSAWKHASRAGVLGEIRRRSRAGEPLATRKVERTKGGGVLISRAKTFYGSWAGALLSAGVNLPPGLMSPWPKADKAAILAEVRRRKRVGETLRVPELERQMWGEPLLNRTRALFGSWNAAVTAALKKRRRQYDIQEAKS